MESAYVNALNRELELRNVLVGIQVPVELVYKECFLGKVYVIDMLIENEIILEIKAVNSMEPVFMAQLITYLKLADKKLGYLINFNVSLLKDGFRRIVNKF